MKELYFPVFMNFSEKKVLVVGGGVIATRRIGTLLKFVGHIEVVAPEITEVLRNLVEKKCITWRKELYCESFIQKKDIVIAATNHHDVNLQIYEDCREEEKKTGTPILVNLIDDKTLCDFYFPSVVMQDDIVIGINSSGTDPKITKTVRKQIEEKINADTIYKE